MARPKKLTTPQKHKHKHPQRPCLPGLPHHTRQEKLFLKQGIY
jgi:hypothetical protein